MGSISSNHPIIDGHVDLIYDMLRHHPDKKLDEISTGHVTLQKMNKGNVNIIVTALFCPDEENGQNSANRYLEYLIQSVEKKLTPLYKIRTCDDLDLCFNGDKAPGTILLLENADALIETDINRLRETGIKSVGLTHAGRNRIGDGNNLPFPKGLTSHGKKIVNTLEKNNFAIDLAHLAEPGFWEIMDIFKGHVMTSHTGLRQFCNIPRNLSWEQIREIIQTRGGVAGISVNPEMLSSDKKADIDDVFKHIDYIAQKIGVDGIAIGSDFCGFDLTGKGIEDISKLISLKKILYTHGYDAEAIRKIMGENWRRFYSSLF